MVAAIDSSENIVVSSLSKKLIMIYNHLLTKLGVTICHFFEGQEKAE
jgi:hypothetical protein